MTFHETKKQHINLTTLTLNGRILDIGGGGEGIMSRYGGDRVIAIDKRADELTETPDIGTKIIMDATSLNFIDNYFDNITCFYTLMYMDFTQIEQFLKEAYRVAKSGAKLWIWDAVIPAEISAEVFVAQLEIKISEEQIITTGYGAAWNREQSFNIIKAFCEKAGFIYKNGDSSCESFSLCFYKK